MVTHPIYERRLLVYADILGWTSAIKCGGKEDNLLAAVELIHREVLTRNEYFRDELRNEERQGKIRLSPMAMQVQFAAFSDHFVFSIPESFGGRILTISSKLIRDLLRLGYLTRGAVVLGDLYHRDNIIFGPALLRADELERKAVQPRILIDDEIVEHLTRETTEETGLLLKDQEDSFVLNPFALPILPSSDLLENFVLQNFFFAEIKALIDQQINELVQAGREQQADKWRYMRQLIGDRVMHVIPELKPFWSLAP